MRAFALPLRGTHVRASVADGVRFILLLVTALLLAACGLAQVEDCLYPTPTSRVYPPAVLPTQGYPLESYDGIRLAWFYRPPRW